MPFSFVASLNFAQLTFLINYQFSSSKHFLERHFQVSKMKGKTLCFYKNNRLAVHDLVVF